MNNSIKTIRLSKTNKPSTNKTFQEQLTNEEIEELLEDYKEVDNDEINSIPLNSHLRYYTLKNENGNIKKLFRMGGFLSNKDNSSEYIILTNNKNSWSVQIKNSIIYRKMNLQEIKDEYEEIIDDKDEEIENLKKSINKIISEKDLVIDTEIKNELKSELSKYKKEIKRLRNILKDNNILY